MNLEALVMNMTDEEFQKTEQLIQKEQNRRWSTNEWKKIPSDYYEKVMNLLLQIEYMVKNPLKIDIRTPAQFRNLDIHASIQLRIEEMMVDKLDSLVSDIEREYPDFDTTLIWDKFGEVE